MSYINKLILVFVCLLVIGCTEDSKDNKKPSVIKSTVESVTPAQKSMVSISPLNASVNSIIRLDIRDKTISTSNIRWYVNGSEDVSARSVRFSSTHLTKGDIVTAIVYDGNQEYTSNEIQIINTPPTIEKARILPSLPTVLSRLTLNVTAVDPDNDNISYRYNWKLNGNFTGEESTLDTVYKRGDRITVEITPFDNEHSGKSVTLKSTIVNSLPVISEGSKEFADNIYKYQISAIDPDGDSLTFKIEEGHEGMNVGPSSGLVTWEVGPNDAGIYEFKVSVSDNNGGKILLPLTTVISEK